MRKPFKKPLKHFLDLCRVLLAQYEKRFHEPFNQQLLD